MIRASALYIVIIITLVIAVLCSALIVSAYFYREQYALKSRYDRLQNNVSSGVNILLADSTSFFTEAKSFSLFENEQDSVTLKRFPWGIFDIGISRAFIQQDTLTKVFSIGQRVDSAKWAALYLTDEDRSLAVSGKTVIRGNVFIPKAGIRTAYVDNQSYQGNAKLVNGHQYHSEKTLPVLSKQRLAIIQQYFTDSIPNGSNFFYSDTVKNLFSNPLRSLTLGHKAVTLSGQSFFGNIIIRSDTVLTLDSTLRLHQSIIIAKSIIVKDGFRGDCQLFAADSIRVGSRCIFNYPSCIGVLRLPFSGTGQLKLQVGDGSVIAGTVFTWDPENGPLKPLLKLGKQDTIRGQVYSNGILTYQDQVVIYGSVFAHRFLYQRNYTAYENYLVNFTTDVQRLSPYYLTGALLPFTGRKNQILQWLESK